MKKFYYLMMVFCILFVACKPDNPITPDPPVVDTDTIPIDTVVPLTIVDTIEMMYPSYKYTVPSYTPFCVAMNKARQNMTDANIQAIYDRAEELVGKEEPYCMVATINGDPHTRMGFCWFTNDSITDGMVQLIPSEDATEADFEAGAGVITFEANATRTKALRYTGICGYICTTSGLPKNLKINYMSHKATATQLTPGTAYSWRCGYPGHWSEIGRFRTEDEGQGEFSFIYMSDSHIMNLEYIKYARRCALAAVKTVPEARFCVFPGDFVEDGTIANSEWEWERWFEESLKPVIMKMPIAPTDGNHDDSNNLNYTVHFNTDNEFNVMVTRKPQFEGIVYSFVYGDALFLVFSMQDFWREDYSYTAKTSEYLTDHISPWFREQVRQNPNTKYRLSLAHFNLFSGSDHSTDEEPPLFRACMLPTMKACEIDVALQGHDHTYEVIGPVDPDSIKPILSAISDREIVPVDDNKNRTGYKGGTYRTDDGTLYFIGATCGRKKYYPHSRERMERDYENGKHDVPNYFDLFTGMFGQPEAPSFTKITVKEDCIEFNSYTADDDEGNVTLYNTMRVVRTKPHTVPQD